VVYYAKRVHSVSFHSDVCRVKGKHVQCPFCAYAVLINQNLDLEITGQSSTVPHSRHSDIKSCLEQFGVVPWPT